MPKFYSRSYNNSPEIGYVLTSDFNGLVSWASSSTLFVLATASDFTLGGIIVGTGLTISSTGVLNLENIVVDTNVYNSNGTVNSDRTITLDEHDFTIQGAGIGSQQILFYHNDNAGSISSNTILLDQIVSSVRTPYVNSWKYQYANELFNSVENGVSGYNTTISQKNTIIDFRVNTDLGVIPFRMSIDANGLLINNQYTLPKTAPTSGQVLGYSSTGVSGWVTASSILATASDSTLGGIIVGGGLTMSNSGVLSLSNSSTSNEAKAIYIDATYGNNSTGVKYDMTKPYLTWAGAIAVAISGDWIIFNAGSYGGGTMTPVNNVNVFCKPGVTISGGFSISSSITWKFLGNAIFTSTDPLRVVGTGQTYDIQFDFDKIEGVVNFGIIIADNTSPSCKLLINCNSIIASQPFRLNGGAVYDVVVNCKNRLSTYGSQAITIGNGTNSPISGSVVVNCPIIETTSTASNRGLIVLGNGTRNLTINSSIIRSTSATFSDSGISNLACLVWVNGDNCIINGDLDGGAIPCIINNTSGSTPVYGNITFIGNMYSDREIVQHYQKAANGNGWQNIIIKNGYISSKGIGYSDAMFHRANAWNSIHGGIPGNIQLIDCVVHNKNFNASATASIMRDDVIISIKQNNFQMYNSLAFIDGGIGYLISTFQASKETSLHNVRSNVDKMAVVVDTFSPSGLMVDINLIIPKSKL